MLYRTKNDSPDSDYENEDPYSNINSFANEPKLTSENLKQKQPAKPAIKLASPILSRSSGTSSRNSPMDANLDFVRGSDSPAHYQFLEDDMFEPLDVKDTPAKRRKISSFLDNSPPSNTPIVIQQQQPQSSKKRGRDEIQRRESAPGKRLSNCI